MGILDFSTQSQNYSYTSTITQNDSGNTTLSNTRTVDNAGNVTLNLNQAGAQSGFEKYLPWAGLGLVAVGIARMLR